MIKLHLHRITMIGMFVIVLFGQHIHAQGAYRLTLEEVVALAQSDAPDALLASTRWKRNYWTYQSYLADFKPAVLLNANTLPLFNRSIEPVTQPNGEELYVERAYMENNLNVSLRQDVALTGGTLYFGSGLRRLDQFATEGNEAYRSFVSTPINFAFDQPLFQFNAMKWRRQIEPMVYRESEKIYAEQMEAVANQAAAYFFNLLISQLDAEAAEQDKANADTLLVLSRGRYEVGKIAETDLLQVEINAMQAETRLAAAQLEMQTNAEQLRDFLDLQGQITFELIPPYTLPTIMIDEEKALAYAMQNRSNVVSFERRLMEANMEVQRAKGESGITASLQGSFGLTQTGAELDQVYTDLIDQEVVTFGISVPIADWGKSKARREVALSNLDLEQRQVDQEKENFRRTVVLRAQQFDLVQRNAEIAERYLEAARKRYEISYQRYLIGKISVTDLNLALADQESARRGYLQSVREFWMALYEIRGMTLYDFVADKSLVLQTPVGD
ncbi:MAG: TolC family protein [Saprospiraceae bacterium]|nr:TolC family protein [Candidatus Opimibacter skivensis]MBP8086343.1 TolC family protein [Saprospiraceae bacterium]